MDCLLFQHIACPELSGCQGCCLAAKQRHCCQSPANQTLVVMTLNTVRCSGSCLLALGLQDCSCRSAMMRSQHVVHAIIDCENLTASPGLCLLKGAFQEPCHGC